MISWAVTFLIIAIIAGILGFSGIEIMWGQITFFANIRNNYALAPLIHVWCRHA